jgi:hypothetical protein
MQRADGYGYVWQTTQLEQPKARASTGEDFSSARFALRIASRSAPFLTALKDGVSRSKF